VSLDQAARGQKSGRIRQLGRWLWAKKIWFAAAIAVVFVAATAYVVWAVQDLPDPSQGVLAVGDVVVLDRHGKLIEDWNHEGHYHINLQLSQMGKYAPAATLAAEDRNFYHHGGVDVGSTLRALWVDATSGGLNQGGSTITQQLVKIQLLTPQKSLERKVHEMVLAVALEQRFSKDQILAMYLNRVYYGHGGYGGGGAGRSVCPSRSTASIAAFAPPGGQSPGWGRSRGSSPASGRSPNSRAGGFSSASASRTCRRSKACAAIPTAGRSRRTSSGRRESRGAAFPNVRDR